MLHWLQQLPIADPTMTFLMVLVLILLCPMLFEKFRIPSIVGLIAAGICVGPHGLNILEYDSAFETFGKVGLYYIMFLASLEMNLQDVKKDQNAAFIYGLLTFSVPMALGLIVNTFVLGCTLAASILMASMYASHTLLTYPIVMRFGISQRRSVNIAVGGTIIADTLTLLVLAVVAGIYREEGVSNLFWLILILKVIVISFAIIVAFPRICRWFFRHYDDGVVQYIFVLILVFLGAELMELVGMEGILGAFLVGIVLNRTIPISSPLMSHIEFVGNALFIPYFLIGVGMIINVGAIFQGFDGLLLAIVMIITAFSGKWIAAWIGQWMFRLEKSDMKLLFGLSSARAAATLAIMLVGSRIILPATHQAIFSESYVNGAMLLILASCVASSMMTDRAAREIMLQSSGVESTRPKHSHMIVAIARPEHTNSLMHAALMLNNASDSQVSAVSVVTSDDAELRNKGLKALSEAAKIAATVNMEIHTQCRFSVNTVTGLTHSAKELDATDILIGLHDKRRISDNFFGRFAPDLISAASQQIIIYRSLIPINTLRRIHIVVPRRAEYEPGFTQWADRLAQLSLQLAVHVDIYSGHDTLSAIREYWKKAHIQVQADYINYSTFDTFQPIAASTRQDHLVIFIAARSDMPSHEQGYLNHLPEQLERYFSTRSIMIIYPSAYDMKEAHPSVLNVS